MEDTAPVRRFERLGYFDVPAARLANVGMIERGDRTRLQREAVAMLGHQPLDGDDAVEAGIAGLPDFPHPTRAKRRQNLYGPRRMPTARLMTIALADYSGWSVDFRSEARFFDVPSHP